MTDHRRTLAAAIVGAAVGGAVGYLFFTERGRAFRRRLEPALEDLAREIGEVRGALTRATSVAGQGWRILHDVMSDPRYVQTRQTSPF